MRPRPIILVQLEQYGDGWEFHVWIDGLYIGGNTGTNFESVTRAAQNLINMFQAQS